MIGLRNYRQLFSHLLLAVVLLAFSQPLFARSHAVSPSPTATARPPLPKTPAHLDDSLAAAPAADLLLRMENQHKGDALAHFVEGIAFEESGEMDKALAAYRKVLDVDPGQADLAARVASILTRQEDFPQAIDILKDAVKANPKAPEPLLQLAYIHAKYLHRTDQAIDYANRAIALDPRNVDAYERLCEVAIAVGDERKALQSLDRAFALKSDDPVFWTRLGKLYASVVFKPDRTAKPEEIARVNDIFKKAVEHAGDNTSVLKDLADYYVSTQQINEAIPLYLRLLDLEPEDSNAREKLAAGFLLTNQRDKAVVMLEQIIKQHPEKYQPYDLLGGLLDDTARALEREK
jgi:tetratricopeptide (TPR) repeat protein